MSRRFAMALFTLGMTACNASSCAGGQPQGALRCTPAASALHFDGPHALSDATVYGVFPRWPDGGFVRRADGGLSLTTPGFIVEGEMSRPLCAGGDGGAHVRIKAWYLDDINARNPRARDLAPGTYAVRLPWGTVWPPMHQVELEARRRLADGGRSYCGAVAGTMTFSEISPARVAGAFDLALGTDRGRDAGELTGWFDFAPCAPPRVDNQ